MRLLCDKCGEELTNTHLRENPACKSEWEKEKKRYSPQPRQKQKKESVEEWFKNSQQALKGDKPLTKNKT